MICGESKGSLEHFLSQHATACPAQAVVNSRKVPIRFFLVGTKRQRDNGTKLFPVCFTNLPAGAEIWDCVTLLQHKQDQCCHFTTAKHSIWRQFFLQELGIRVATLKLDISDRKTKRFFKACTSGLCFHMPACF